MAKGDVVHSLQHLTQALRWNPAVMVKRLARVLWSVLTRER
jgi:hypothetical protein